MPHRTFFWFILPSLTAMILFIALPIISVAVQSLFIEHEQVMIEVENCGPFKCETALQVDQEATAKLVEEAPLGRFNALGTYTDRNHLAFSEIGVAWSETGTISEFVAELLNCTESLCVVNCIFFALDNSCNLHVK